MRVWLTVGEALCFPYNDDEEYEGSCRFGMYSLINNESKWVGVLYSVTRSRISGVLGILRSRGSDWSKFAE